MPFIPNPMVDTSVSRRKSFDSVSNQVVWFPNRRGRPVCLPWAHTWVRPYQSYVPPEKKPYQEFLSQRESPEHFKT